MSSRTYVHQTWPPSKSNGLRPRKVFSLLRGALLWDCHCTFPEWYRGELKVLRFASPSFPYEWVYVWTDFDKISGGLAYKIRAITLFYLTVSAQNLLVDGFCAENIVCFPT
ncbi:hypothetical protein LAZ67_14002104 [Cordylochernes scorpioides]|uniref:Uncharacterized protein n=1 Tax=Cordylochernes scorpioides TaxID=51811 RepID=A0ABY6L6N6_9ARAC|nr:hypothetical protein LAZ67_14002104 [Cordylochernes scorpioides]